jgi:hypothetical protein
MTMDADQPFRSRWPFMVHAGSSTTTAGKLASRAWLLARALHAPPHAPWHVEIALDTTDDTNTALGAPLSTRLRLEIHSEEWGVYFCHEGKASWIRVTDVPFVHGCDDFRLLRQVPALKDIGNLLRELELQNGIRFDRQHAAIGTNVGRAEPVVKSWLRQL